jgi:hypothetical protein
LRDGIEHCYQPVKHERGWADFQMRPERALVRHWQLVLLAYTCSLLVGTVPTAPPTPAAATAPAAASSSDHESTGGEIIGARSSARVTTGGVGRDAAPRAELALPVGTAAALLATLVEQRPTARAGRAPRPRRQLSAP